MNADRPPRPSQDDRPSDRDRSADERPATDPPGAAAAARPRDVVYVIDGTLASLEAGRESHAGRLHRLLCEGGAHSGRQHAYHPGVQGEGAAKWWRALIGRGVNDSIRQGYAFLSSRARPGDRLFLFGYSRGAYAVRSLAGLIDRLGLLRPEAALQRRVRQAFRHYEAGPSTAAEAFSARHCRRDACVEMIGVWDTVKALGVPLPVLSRFHPMATAFHDHALGPSIRFGAQALALDEDRTAFAPVMWEHAPDWRGRIEQRWFPGAHMDVGGQVGGFPQARPLANLSLVWMLELAEAHGLALPDGWRGRFETDPAAPMHGPRRGRAAGFLLRAPRQVDAHPGEDLHPSVAARMEATGYAPRALGLLPEPGPSKPFVQP
ncbi:MAG: DUF2235 domain-containing protein [Pseudomonadota bacterium]